MIRKIPQIFHTAGQNVRRYKKPLAIIPMALLIGTIAASSIMMQPTTTSAATTTSPTPSPSPSPSPDPGQKFGLSTGELPFLGTNDLNMKLSGMRKLGIRWVRFDVQWNIVQPGSQSAFDWSAYDRIMAALNANGLQGLAVIDYTPAWAGLPSCAAVSNKCRPNDPTQFATFAGRVAARYAPQGLHAYEVWNEPNAIGYWLPAPNVADYTKLLTLSYDTIKAFDSNSTVLTGGTSASTTTSNGQYISSAAFMSGIYANGGKGSFDAVALHPYTRPFLPLYTGGWNPWQNMSNSAPNVHQIMADNGEGSKKIWVTEYGAPTGGPGAAATTGMSTTETGLTHETEDLESTTVTQAVSLYTSYPWAGPFFWYSYQDKGTDQTNANNFYGLLRFDGTKKPAFSTYKQAIANYHP